MQVFSQGLLPRSEVIEDTTQTRDLLERLHGGDRNALTELVQNHLGWLESRIHADLNARLRRRGDTQDYLHDIVVRILKTQTPFVINDEDHFRRILLRMVNNLLTDGGRRVDAQRRAVARERKLPTRISVLYLNDPPANHRPPAIPLEQAAADEDAGYLHFALELLVPDERRLIEMREEEGMSFASIGEELGTTDEAARKRFSRALKRLGKVLLLLRSGDVDRALATAGAPAGTTPG